MTVHIGVDLDNTVMDATTAHLHYYNLASGRAFTPADVNDFYLYKLYGWNQAERDAVYTQYGHDIHWHSEPLPMAAEMLRELFRQHRISVITARPLTVRDVTLDWLKKHEMPYHEIVFIEDKLQACLDGGVDVLIDDGPHYAEAFSRARRPLILVDQPYNMAVKYDLVYRASDWIEVRKHVNDLASGLHNRD